MTAHRRLSDLESLAREWLDEADRAGFIGDGEAVDATEGAAGALRNLLARVDREAREKAERDRDAWRHRAVVAEAWQQSVISEAASWAARDSHSMVWDGDGLLVQVERYNEVANRAHLAAGAVVVLTDQLRAARESSAHVERKAREDERHRIAVAMTPGVGDAGWCGCQSLRDGQTCGQCGMTYEEAKAMNERRAAL